MIHRTPTDQPSRARVGITAVGASLPERMLSTTALQQRVATASGVYLPADLFSRTTGIDNRRIADDTEYASTLAVRAARRALAAADLDPLDIDLLLFASATRDVAEPATAHIVQAELGSRAHALDVTNACNSFLNGIDLARSLILAGRVGRALVVTGETPTRAMRPRLADPAQARAAFAGYTFGDAGAAVVVEPVTTGGIIDIDTETWSEHWRVGGSPAAARDTRAGTSTLTSMVTATRYAGCSRRSAPTFCTGYGSAPAWTGPTTPGCWSTRSPSPIWTGSSR